MEKISVLITDDHILLREGFSRSLKYNKSIGTVDLASSGKEALDLIRKNHYDIIFMDLLMKELNGLETMKLILKENPVLKIIIFSQFEDEENINKCMGAGAKGYLTKDSNIQEINLGIKEVLKGDVFYSKVALNSIALNKHTNKFLPKLDFNLTPKETQIIQEICNGCTDKEIGIKFKISKRTVEWHKQNIFKKTKNKTAIGIINFAVKHSIFNIK